MFSFLPLESIRAHTMSLIGTGTAWLGVGMVNQQQLEFWVKMAGGAGAILVSIVTIWSIIRRDRRESRGK